VLVGDRWVWVVFVGLRLLGSSGGFLW